MEASQAGEAAQAEGQEGQNGEQQAPDVGQLMDRFGELQQGLEGMNERFDTIESRIPEQDDWGLEEEGQEQDLRYITDEEGNVLGALTPDGELVDEGAQQFDPQQAIEQARAEARQEVMKQVAPILDHFADQEAEKIQSKYPQLQDHEFAESIVAEGEQTALQLLGDEGMAKQLASKPGFAELMYLAKIGRDQAQSETPAGAEDDQVFLEGPGASSPGSGEQDESDRIAEAYGAGRNSPLWR